MEPQFSPRVVDVITFSKEEALRLGHDYIGTEHLLLGLIREGQGNAIKMLTSSGVNTTDLRKSIEMAVKSTTSSSVNLNNIPLTKQAEKALKLSFLKSKEFKSSSIGTEHLLLSILSDDDNIASQLLKQFGVTFNSMTEEMNLIKNNMRAEAPQSSDDDPYAKDDDNGGMGGASKKPGDSKSKTPVLDNFGRDLTKAAEEGKLDPIVGREKEIERVSQILSRRKKNNPILLDEPGVG